MRGFNSVTKIFLIYTAALSFTSAQGQSPAVALKNLQRQKWQRAYELLTRAKAKDSLNVTAKYVLAQYFFLKDNPAFHLDSAYRHIQEAQNHYEALNKKQRDKISKFPVDSILLSSLRLDVERAAFTTADEVHSEEAWVSFIKRFPTSIYIPDAIRLRDSLAYNDAEQEHTYAAFQNFLTKYPNARQREQASSKYERLLYEAKTADQSLASFERFLAEYPNSTYRSVVERTIFEYRTASGEQEDFDAFIRNYPDNAFMSTARNILFHLIPESEKSSKWSQAFETDSLKRVIALQNTYLVPFLKNKMYGFMDRNANEVIPAMFDSLDASYLCGNINDDLIVVHEKIISNSGSQVWSKRGKIEEIGAGFVLIEDEDSTFLMHKSGFRIGDYGVDDAKILNGKIIATKRTNRWSVLSLAGRTLATGFDAVTSIGNVICLTKNNSVRLVSRNALTTLPRANQDDERIYDEVKQWSNNLIWVREKGKSGLLDQELRVVVPLTETTLTPSFFGVISSTSEGFKLYAPPLESDTYKNVIGREPWLAVKDSVWTLIDSRSFERLSLAYDSIVFYGPFAVGQKADSSYVHFNNNTYWKGAKPDAMDFIPGRNVAYLWIETKGRKSIYNTHGEKLLTGTFDKIQHAGDELFIVHRAEKKGLINSQGKLLLPIGFDAIGTVNEQTVSLLKNGRFGLFDLSRKKQIPTVYEKNLIAYNRDLNIASREGLYGFVGWDNKPVGTFEFKEIRYWNDTTALVKKDNYWMLYEIKSARALLDKIKNFTMIRDLPNDKLAIIYQESDHGVIHNLQGFIIPVSYSDIVNVGSRDTPLYFTEKHVEEADAYVVIYYDDEGHPLKKEIYDQDEYEKIYCHAN